MKKRIVLFAVLSGMALPLFGRVVTSLSGDTWTLDGVPVTVPHTWNAEDAADGKDRVPKNRGTSVGSPSYFRAARTYARALPDPTPGCRSFIRCEGVSSKAEVRVNGAVAGRHAGAFTAFCFEITDLLKPVGNTLEIVADNTYDTDVPPISGDFSMFGGVYRDVWLIETPRVCISPLERGGRGVALEPNAETGEVIARVSVLGGTNEVQRFDFGKPELWSPENPRLYTVKVRIRQQGCADEVEETFGFRTVEFRSDGFYLNGTRRVIHGVCRHQDRDGKGWAVSAADEAEDVAWIKRMGADGVRTAHYPHSENFYRLCDRRGILVWTEIPCIDEVSFTAAFRSNLTTVAREMVAQHRNHPSIVMWGLYNELFGEGGNTMPEAPVLELMREPLAAIHEMDPSRPVTSATCDPARTELNTLTDVQGVNLYPGWYDVAPWYSGDGGEMSNALARVFAANPAWKTIAVSEYGAGASVNQHADPLLRTRVGSRFYPEEYQASLHAAAYRVLAGDSRIWGVFPWVMFDLAADRRQEADRHGINNKGLVTYDRKTAKDAFYLYKANWNPEPELHLVGARMTVTTNAAMNVMAFSNVGTATLSVNGRRIGTCTPDAVKTCLWRNVPLAEGRNEVTVEAGGLIARAVWTRTARERLVIAQRGRAAVRSIVVSEAAGPSEAFAAAELQNWTRQLTGVTLPIVTNGCPARAICIRKVDDAKLGDDGFRLCAEGDGLRIEGGVRGVLYGVYELLETHGGIGWFASYCTVVPKAEAFTVPADLDVTQKPAFKMREEYFYDMHAHGDFSARQRLNGSFNSLGERHGGIFGRVGAKLRSHTFFELVDIGKYGKTHPEYFSEIDGRRVITDDPKHQTQLCLSNPEVLEILTTNLFAAIRSDPSAARYGVSQNDNDFRCRCSVCAAIDAEEGSAAGTNVRFVNAVADRVAKEFPGKLVQTLAYRYTRAPTKTRYRDNVLLELCPIECDCAHPVATGRHPENAAFRRDFDRWSPLVRNLFIWNYVTDFRCFPMPFPDVLTLQEDVKYFHAKGVRWLSPEGPYRGYGADFAALKGWLLAKWMWNPEADRETLLKRFFAGYYGAAAPLARQYFDELHRLVGEDGKEMLSCFQEPYTTKPVTDEFLVRARQIWQAAVEMVKDDPPRLRAARMGLFAPDVVRYLRLVSRIGSPSIMVRRRAPDNADELRELRETAVRINSVIKDYPPVILCESWVRDPVLKRQIALDATGQSAYAWDGFKPCDSVTLQESSLTLMQRFGFWCHVVDDATACGGKAVELSNRTNEWCVQLPLNKASFDADGRYQIRVCAKVRLKPGADGRRPAFSSGVSDRANRPASRRRDVRVSEIDGDGWNWYTVATFRPGENQVFWFASGTFDKTKHNANPNVEAVLLDQIEISRVDD